MTQQQEAATRAHPSPTTTATRALWAAAAVALVAAFVVAVQQDGLRDELAAAYHYGSGTELEDAQSWTSTYLFALAGVAFGTFAVAARHVGRPRVRMWATAIAVIGAGVAVYNATQPFPVGVQAAGLVAAFAGAAAVAASWRVPVTRT